MILCRRIDSPVGPLMLAADDSGLRHIEFRDNRHPVNRGDWHGGDNPILQATEAQLAEYFSGTRTRFDLPLAPRGTEFQLRVWQALALIPHGKTSTYAEQARAIGSPDAVRAVFTAVGPSFRNGVRLPAFDNVDVYPLLTRLLRITPAPNDGDIAPLLPALKDDR